jgi:hypothetical protein
VSARTYLGVKLPFTSRATFLSPSCPHAQWPTLRYHVRLDASSVCIRSTWDPSSYGEASHHA